MSDERPEDARLGPPDAGSMPGEGPIGGRIFSLEGRAAPGLYLVGWIATLLGVGAILVAVLGTGNSSAGILLLGGFVVASLGLASAAGAQIVERRRRSGLVYRGPSPLLLVAVVLTVTPVALVIVLAPLAIVGLVAIPSPGATLLGEVVTVGVDIAVVALFVVRTGALTWSDMGVRRPGLALVTDVAVGAILVFPVLFVTGLLAVVLSRLLPTPEDLLPPVRSGLDLAANLVTAAVLAPIGEELFFRGFMTTAWARTMGSRRAIGWGAIVFAAAHVLSISGSGFADAAQLALFAFVARIPVAIVLGWLFLERRSLAACIGLHSAFNAIPIILLAFRG